MQTKPGSTVDRSVKGMLRSVPDAFLRLLDEDAGSQEVTFENVTVNLPEHAADGVLLVGGPGNKPSRGFHLEAQLHPDRRVMQGWMLKNAAFNVQLGIDIPLVVLYLSRGRYRRFPNTHIVSSGGLTNTHTFTTIQLWEHAERIRAGELPELAPLLVLCEEHPNEETLRTERELIRKAPVTDAVRSDLVALAFTVGTRYFTRTLLQTVFREELNIMRSTSIIDDWIKEAEVAAVERGKVLGAEHSLRIALLEFLVDKFGAAPKRVRDRIENSTASWCRARIIEAGRAQNIDEINWS